MIKIDHSNIFWYDKKENKNSIKRKHQDDAVYLYRYYGSSEISETKLCTNEIVIQLQNETVFLGKYLHN
jgi:hypothetical protein